MASSIPTPASPLLPTTKTCSQCQQVKALDAFSRQRKAKDGRQATCKACHNASSRAWRLSHPRSYTCSDDEQRTQVHALLEACLDAERGPLDCWPWRGPTNGKGYGLLEATVSGRRMRLRAHRAAFLLAYGYLPQPPLQIRHAVCGNRLCCNPQHLAAGTMKDNAQDMVRMGRCAQTWSKRSRVRILCPADVQQIRALRAAGRPAAELAERFKVGTEQIRRIVRGTAWPTISEGRTE